MHEAVVRLIKRSDAQKLGPIASTYRAGKTEPFATCPSTCPLLPASQKGTTTVDVPYLEAVIRSKPKRGESWTYTHFPYQDMPRPDGGTIINVSVDTVPQALEAADAGYPVAYAAPLGEKWPQRIEGRHFVICPASKNKTVDCARCGGGRPLCARPERDYVVVFPAHGSRKKLVGHSERGGCYGAQGNTWIHWQGTAEKEAPNIISNDDILRELPRWSRKLPPGSLLRHHVVGDLGCANPRSIERSTNESRSYNRTG